MNPRTIGIEISFPISSYQLPEFHQPPQCRSSFIGGIQPSQDLNILLKLEISLNVQRNTLCTGRRKLIRKTLHSINKIIWPENGQNNTPVPYALLQCDLNILQSRQSQNFFPLRFGQPCGYNDQESLAEVTLFGCQVWVM